MVEREVGTLWIGGDLSWFEQLCLKSHVDKGQKITLFHYEPVGGVPDGVILRDGREIIDTDDFIKYQAKDSFALFADLFRLHMIQQCEGMIWIDTDVYCWQPMNYEIGPVFGLELRGKNRVNNAVLGFAPDDPMLQAMIDFTDDRFPEPPFLNQFRKADIQQRRAAGDPMHVSEMPWGVWGPLLVTYFAKKFGYVKYAQPVEAFYPVVFPDRKLYLRAPRRALAYINEETTSLHLWASLKKPIGYNHQGLPPNGSFLDMLCKKHEIDPAQAPVLSRGVHKFDVDENEESEG